MRLVPVDSVQGGSELFKLALTESKLIHHGSNGMERWHGWSNEGSIDASLLRHD